MAVPACGKRDQKASHDNLSAINIYLEFRVQPSLEASTDLLATPSETFLEYNLIQSGILELS
jgi:hypothetical protein